MADFISVDMEYQSLVNELKAFNEEMPNIARKLMRKVNAEVKRQVKKAAKQRGYHAHKNYEGKKGIYDTGYQKNLKSYADRDYRAKIMFTSDAYYYKWIEYGANVPERKIKAGNRIITFKGFTLPANPLLHPIANSIWGTSRASEIMDEEFQKEINKQFK